MLIENSSYVFSKIAVAKAAISDSHIRTSFQQSYKKLELQMRRRSQLNFLSSDYAINCYKLNLFILRA